MAEVPADRALRAELGELRAQVAERDRAIALLGDQVSALRRANAGLAEQNRVLAEQNRVLAEQNRVLGERLGELERRLGQNPRNSSQPPSSEGYAKPPPASRRRRSGRGPGGQPGSPGATLAQVPDPDEVLVHAPAWCRGCGGSLAGAPVASTEARQVADLPRVRLRWAEHRVEHRRCGCGAVTTAGPGDGLPEGVRAPAQYGPGVRAAATYLVAAQHLPVDRAARALGDLLGAPVSAGSVAAWVAAAAQGLDPFCQRVRDRIAAAPVACFDETGLRVDGRLAWVHAAATSTDTLFTVSDRRGRAGIDAAGVLPAFTGIAVHDCWAPYFAYPTAHALCNAHLGRELTGVWESAGQSWAAKLDIALDRLNAHAHAARQAGQGEISPQLLAGMHAKIDAIIAQGRAANPAPDGGWGRKKPVAVNLLDRLAAHRDDYLRFSVDLRVPYTSNQAEQDIRPVKIRQKISGCLRTTAGAQAFCKLRSYLHTARKHDRQALDVLRQLQQGRPWLPDPAPG